MSRMKQYLMEDEMDSERNPSGEMQEDEQAEADKTDAEKCKNIQGKDITAETEQKAGEKIVRDTEIMDASYQSKKLPCLKKRCKRKKAYSDRRTKWSRRQIVLRIFLILLCCLAAVVVFLFIFRAGGSRQLKRAASMSGAITAPEQAETDDNGKTVTYQGKQWIYNENMVAILCIGVDTEQFPAESQDRYQNGGFADTLFLLAVDTKKGNGVLLPISRYTMGMVDTYQSDGSYGGQEEMQLAYAYAYGDGGKESCENTAKAVSRFLYGIPISGYAALDMSGVAPLNDAVGGVTLDINEDLTDADPAFFQGNTLTLSGEQALRFVRYRISEGEELETDNNAPRMQRQEQFLQAFAKQFFQQIRKEPGLPLTCYQLLKKYMVTDITPSETLYLSTLLADHGDEISVVSLPGTAQKGEYTEVYVDRERLYEILLDVFYTKK